MPHAANQSKQFGQFKVTWDYNDGTGFFTILNTNTDVEDFFKWPPHMRIAKGGKKNYNRIDIIVGGLTKRIFEDLPSDQLKEAYEWMRYMMTYRKRQE